MGRGWGWALLLHKACALLLHPGLREPLRGDLLCGGPSLPTPLPPLTVHRVGHGLGLQPDLDGVKGVAHRCDRNAA